MEKEEYKIKVERIPVSQKNSWVFEKEYGRIESILEMTFTDPEKAEKEFRTVLDKGRGYYYDEDIKRGWFLSVTLKPSVIDGEEFEDKVLVFDCYTKLVDDYS